MKNEIYIMSNQIESLCGMCVPVLGMWLGFLLLFNPKCLEFYPILKMCKKVNMAFRYNVCGRGTEYINMSLTFSNNAQATVINVLLHIFSE